MLIRRVLKEKFVENQYSICSYVEYGPELRKLQRGNIKLFITISEGKKMGNKKKHQQYKEETKKTYDGKLPLSNQ